MQVDIERRKGSKVALTITVEPELMKTRMEQLFHKQAQRVTVPGFRPGKAPRKMIEERIDHERLFNLALDAVIDATYRDALLTHNLSPLEQGSIEEIKPAPDLSLTYRILVTVRPEVTLPDYKGLQVHRHTTTVSDEMVDNEIMRLRQEHPEYRDITDDGIQTGDYVTVDYTMTLNGEPYPEGDLSGYPLIVGSDTIFPVLNEGLLGVKFSKTKILSIDYPEDYSDKNLAGKTAEIAVTVQQIRRRILDVNDEWVNAVTNGSIETLEALRERIRQNLEAMAERSDHDQMRNELVRKVMTGAEVDLPEVEVEEEFKHLMEEFENRMTREGTTLAAYARSQERTVEDIEADYRLTARDMVRHSRVLGEVARRENITVTDDDLDATLAMDLFSRNPGLSQQDLARELKILRKEYEKSGFLSNIEGRIFYEKVVSFLEDQAEIIRD